MLSYFLLVALTAFAGLTSARPAIQGRATFFNSFWTDGKSKVSYKNLANGQFTVTWDKGGNFVGGKGWNPGSATRYVCNLKAFDKASAIHARRVISWEGEFKPQGYAYLAIYGWTTNPLIEYYIIESYHPDHEPAAPPEGEEKGNVTSDGSLYLIRTKMRVNKPSIQGTATFRQIFSVRQDQRENGTVNVANHFQAWKDVGLKTGAMNYQIVAVEGMNSSGMASINVL